MKTSTALAELKATDQDFEWYPTTEEIITAFQQHANNFEPESLLDIGAGNGKVLNRFKELKRKNPDDRDSYDTDYFAIEKARPLLDSLPIDVGILGTDFWEQSLLDKSVECIFSNPPYREFIDWSVKIIREANANHIYLVIPQRWKDQKKIIDAIESRRAGHEVIGEFDFLNSEDRTARAKVDRHHQIKRETLSVRAYMSQVLRDLRGRQHVAFYDLFSPAATVAEVVVTFLAILELAKELLLEISQSSDDAMIYVRAIDAA